MRPPHRFRTEVASSLHGNDLQLVATAHYLHGFAEEVLHNLKLGLGLLASTPRASNPRHDPPVGLAVLCQGS